MTFPHDGAYGHPDHVAISQFTTAATVMAADPAWRAAGAADLLPHAVSKLYVMVSDEAKWDDYQSAFKKLTAMVDGVERVAMPWARWSISAEIDTRAHWRTVWKAASHHESQIANFERLHALTPEQHESLWGRQTFYRVFSTVNGGRALERDLFEGLRTPAAVPDHEEKR